jgi:paraquat-inducible protein B
MSKKASPTLIGAFVFGAILLAIGAVIVFGGANWFSKKLTLVSFFEQSVSGLAVGSNVKFKGVTVGKVTRIVLGFRGEDKPTYVEVFYDIDTTLVVKGLTADVDLFSPQLHKERIDRGLRARLDFESLISGQLYLALNFFKDPAPPNMHPEYLVAQHYLEVPVQPSDIEAILDNLTKAIGNIGRVDFLSLAKNLEDLIVSARAGLDSMKLGELGTSLTKTSDGLSKLVNGPELKATLASVHQSFDELTTTLKKLDTELDPLSQNVNSTLEAAKKSMVGLQASTAELSRLLKPTSGFRYQVDNTLAQISSAADALQRLSEFLERNPNSILFGRKPAKNPP